MRGEAEAESPWVIACAGLAAVLAIYQSGPAAGGGDQLRVRPDLSKSATGALLRRGALFSTVMQLASGTYYYLRTNGLPEASVQVRGTPPSLDTQKWLTALPVAARPDIRDMLVVGFGGGVALEGVPSSVTSIDVVELEPEVIEANRLISGMRDIDPLGDPRFNVVINDARNALKLTGKSYDAIVSQPSHPWTAGASHLFTREFAADVRGHLNEGGVFLQWMNAEFVDEPLLRTLAATLMAEFEYVRLYHPWQRVLMFMASDAPLDVEIELARTGRPIIDDVLHFSRFGMYGVEDLLASLAIDEQGMLSFARRAELSTDDNNLMATRSRARADGLTSQDLEALFEPHDPLLRAGSWVHTQLGGIDYGYLARRLIVLEQTSRATALAEVIPDFSRQFEVYGILFDATGQGDQAPESFANALLANPLNLQARYTSVRGYIDALSRGEAPEDIQEIATELTGVPAAVISGLAYEAAGDWASLALFDEALAQSIVTDAWYPEVARLRAAWRVNATEDRERLAAEALALIEQILILASDENLHTMRAMSARTLGDADRLVESSAYLLSAVNTYLTASASQDYRFSAEELERVRQNLTVIDNNLDGVLETADPQRLSTVLENVNGLLQYVDEYPLEP